MLYLGQDFFPFFTPSLSLEYILYSFPNDKNNNNNNNNNNNKKPTYTSYNKVRKYMRKIYIPLTNYARFKKLLKNFIKIEIDF